MIKKINLTALLFFISVYSYSQNRYQHIIGGPLHERAQSICSSASGGYIVNGATSSYGAGDIDAMLIRTDDMGQITWSNVYGNTGYDNSEYAIETFDQNIVCAGRSILLPSTVTAATLFKTDLNGQVIFSKSFGGNLNDGLYQVIETSDHGYACVGNSESTSSGLSDILLVRTDINGDTVFTRSFGTPESENGTSIIELPDKGFLITGRQSFISGSTLQANGLLLRTDSSGNILWSKQYGDSLWEELTGCRMTNDSGFIICGSTVSYGAGGFDILLMSTDDQGNIEWAKTFGETESDAAYDIQVNPDNSYVISGYTESLGHGNGRMQGLDEANVFLLKTDENGTLAWMQTYGDGLQDEAFRCAKAPDGGYLVAGFTKNYLLTDSSQMLFIKTDAAGESGCHEEAVTPVDSFINLPFQNITLTQLSGISFSNFAMVQTAVTTDNDDACLFASSDKNVLVNEIKAYPVPFSDKLEINLSNIHLPCEIIMFDATGKQLKNLIASEKLFNMETSVLSAGYYILKIKNAKEEFSLPVVKN
jgi:hypothetical protein